MNNRQTFKEWYRNYSFLKIANPEEKLGKAFVDDFLPNSHWEDLYYEQDDDKALGMIVRFLIDAGYYPYVP